MNDQSANDHDSFLPFLPLRLPKRASLTDAPFRGGARRFIWTTYETSQESANARTATIAHKVESIKSVLRRDERGTQPDEGIHAFLHGTEDRPKDETSWEQSGRGCADCMNVSSTVTDSFIGDDLPSWYMLYVRLVGEWGTVPPVWPSALLCRD